MFLIIWLLVRYCMLAAWFEVQCMFPLGKCNILTHFSHQLLHAGHRLALLVTQGWRRLAIPVPQLLNTLQVEQSLQAQAVVLNHCEVLVLHRAADLRTRHTHTLVTWATSWVQVHVETANS